MENTSLIQLENINIKIKNQQLFNNFNLQINLGDKIGVYAPNGSGKSTLINYILNENFISCDFEINGVINKNPELQISAVFQEPRLLEDFSVLKNIVLPLENKSNSKELIQDCYKIINKLGLQELLTKSAGELSGGQKQKTALARALAFPHNLLLLDEPFSALDEETKTKILDFINELYGDKKSFLLISHDLPMLEKLCTKVITQKDFINQ